MISTILISVLLLTGAFFSLLAAIGVIRFPDVYTRMHAATKAPAFGILLLQAGAAIYFNEPYAYVISFLVIVFIFLTAPVASHSISKIAHLINSGIWSKTSIDELAPDEENRDEKTGD